VLNREEESSRKTEGADNGWIEEKRLTEGDLAWLAVSGDVIKGSRDVVEVGRLGL